MLPSQLTSYRFPWNRADCAGRPFQLSVTLASGQSFRWRRDVVGVWWGVIGEVAVAVWQADGSPENPLYWQTFPEADRWDVLADYFRLDVDLETLLAEWVAAEPRIAEAATVFRGLRILRQPPRECCFAFLCAAAKPVSEIEKLVGNLAARYGEPVICEEMRQEGEESPSALCRFPTLETLAAAQESDLRAAGWGFRAPRPIVNARHLLTQPSDWLESLREASYAEAKASLMAMVGIGAKIADCICLFALDKSQAVPVDRHIQRLGCRLFLPELEHRTLTPAVYEAIADAYRARFGDYAGWAQQYLFFGQLRRAGDFRAGWAGE